MSTTEFAPRTDAGRGGAGRPGRPPGRGWAVSGLVAGIAGATSIGASLSVSAAGDEDTWGDPTATVTVLADTVGRILIFHTATMISVVALVVFAAGLARRLRAQAPADSLLPGIAATGLTLVSVAGLLGAGLTTEFAFGLKEDDGRLVPEAAVVFGHWIATIPWLWIGAGIAAVAVAIAALRHAAAPRALGWASLVLGGLTTLFGVSPLQYMAGFLGPIWVIVASLTFLLGDRDGS